MLLYQVGTSPHKLMLRVMLMRASRSRTHYIYSHRHTTDTASLSFRTPPPHGRGSKRRRGPRAWWCLRLCRTENATCETARARTKPERQDACVVQDGTQQCARLLVRTGTEWRRNDARPSEWPQSFSRVSHVHRGEALASLASALALGATRCCTSHTWWRNTAAGTVPRLLGNERRHLPAKPCTVTLGWPKDGQADGLAQRSTRSLAHSPWRLPCMQARRMRACHARAAHPLLDALGCVGCGVRTPSWSLRARGHERKS